MNFLYLHEAKKSDLKYALKGGALKSNRNYKLNLFQIKNHPRSLIGVQLKCQDPNISKFTLQISVWLTLISGLLKGASYMIEQKLGIFMNVYA